jgi:CubicO group peptidase (beta-lactamase class C family)
MIHMHVAKCGVITLLTVVGWLSSGTTRAAETSTNGFVKAADYSAGMGGRAVLVQHHGKIVFERYDNGWTAGLPHPLASGTKSFTGVMAMLAVQDGLLSLDEKACETLTEWKDHPQKSKITVRHLLTLSSGIDPGDANFAGRGGTNLLGFAAEMRRRRLGEQMEQPDNNFLAALDLPMTGVPGRKFQYGPSHFYCFGELLQRKLKASDRPEKTTLDYLTRRLLEPVGIRAARIGKDRAGNPALPGGMLLTAREWIKFGQFVLDEGKVTRADGEKEVLLNPDLLAECFKPSAANKLYGLTWWLRNVEPTRRRASSGKMPAVYMAAGLGKQRLYVIPELDLTIVRFAEGVRGSGLFSDEKFLKLIIESLPKS